jgi:dTDP-4-dehydrorhamnose reductase
VFSVRVLVTGAAGQVGRAFHSLAPAQASVIALTHADLDITDEDAVRRAVGTHKPQWIVNAAAYTAVDRAESATAAAQALNETAVGYLARSAASVAARLVHLSTDFVFDGRACVPYEPNAATAPIGAYGATKLAGERQALGSAARAIIVRTSWVYAAYGQNFARTMLRVMAERPEVHVVCDQTGSPTWATGLAQVLWRMLALDAAAGIYHWCDAGVASWYDFAVAIQEEALQRGLLRHAVPVLPIRSHQYPSAAQRPPYSVLDSTHTRTLIGAPATHWRTQLRKMLNELAAT